MGSASNDTFWSATSAKGAKGRRTRARDAAPPRKWRPPARSARRAIWLRGISKAFSGAQVLRPVVARQPHLASDHQPLDHERMPVRLEHFVRIPAPFDDFVVSLGEGHGLEVLNRTEVIPRPSALPVPLPPPHAAASRSIGFIRTACAPSRRARSIVSASAKPVHNSHASSGRRSRSRAARSIPVATGIA